MAGCLTSAVCLLSAALAVTVVHGRSIRGFQSNEDMHFENEHPMYWDKSQTSEWRPLFHPGHLPHKTNHLLLWPEQKFAFCVIEKNAGTQFLRLMLNLTGGRSPTDGADAGSISRSQAWNLKQNWVDADEISRDTGWRLAVFLRDPAERLLSAWSSKCQKWENAGRNCLGRERVPDDLSDEAVGDFEFMVRELLPKYMAERREHGYFNGHYDPQSMTCGSKTAADYDFVGHISNNPEQVHDEVVDMLQRVARVPLGHAVWNQLSKNFRADAIAGHHSRAAERMATFYRSPDVRATVVREYAEDYNDEFVFSPNFTQESAQGV